jgi:RecB family exonuclease
MPEKPLLTISHSEGRAYKHCQMLHDLKFRRHLAPRVTRRPLVLGAWTHTCLEALYDKTGWQGALEKLIKEDYEPLFDEEKIYYGDLPNQTRHLMELYDYYYEDDPWELVLPPEVPLDFEIETRNYRVRFLGRIDLVVRDKGGRIWVVDHKTGQRIPKPDEPKTFQMMDTQLTFYPWGLSRQYGINAFGTIYNYLKAKPPTLPRMNKDKVNKDTGEIIKEMSRQRITTDVLTFTRFCAENGLSPEDFPEQYEWAKEDTHGFFYRMRVPRDRQGTASTMTDMVNTAIAKSNYRTPMRNVTWLCKQCDMLELCEAEYFGQDTSIILQKYIVQENAYSYLGIFDEVMEVVTSG